MDTTSGLRRLLRACCAFLVGVSAVFAAPAWAAAPVKVFSYVSYTGTGTTTAWFATTIAQSCSQTMAAYDQDVNGQKGWRHYCVNTNYATAYDWKRVCETRVGSSPCTLGAVVTGTNYPQSKMWCPATNTAPDTSKPLDQQCSEPPPPSCTKGQTGTGTWYDSTGENYAAGDTTVITTGGCVNNCSVKMVKFYKCYQIPSTGKNYCTYGWESTGGTCSAGSGSPAPESPAPSSDGATRKDLPPSNAPPGSKCPEGSVQGGVSADGVPICIGTGSDPKNAPPPQPKVQTEKTEATPDGGSKTTNTTTTTNADGSTTTVTMTTTTAPDGTKTVTVDKNTTVNSSGGAGKDDSQREDEKYDLCKQNPMLTICRNSSVAGTCGQITCQGDAIQCATLRAAATMECKQREDEAKIKAMPSTGLGESILGGTDPMKEAIDGALKGTEVDMSQPALDDSGFVAAQCLPDRSFVVAGRTIEVKFSKWCGVIEPLKYAVVACAWIVAYSIVARSVLGA